MQGAGSAGEYAGGDGRGVSRSVTGFCHGERFVPGTFSSNGDKNVKSLKEIHLKQ